VWEKLKCFSWGWEGPLIEMQDTVNPKQVFDDLEILIGRNALLRQCASYIGKASMISEADAIFPPCWIKAEAVTPVRLLGAEWDGDIDMEIVKIMRSAPGAPKKLRRKPKFVDNLPPNVARTLHFIDECDEEDGILRFSPIMIA
jgi:hypothetical protein